MNATRLLLTLVALLLSVPAHAVTIDWVTVGDPGNTADTSGFGAVGQAFQIMKYEWTNSLYADFLNAVDPEGTNPNSIYITGMGSSARGGISFTSSGASGFKYAAKTNMADKPLSYGTWWNAARVANWLHNGAQAYATSDASASAPQNTGAYTLGTATSGPAPAKNSGAQFYIPTEDQWYKAAYYKGGGNNAGYWDYATRSDTAPVAVTSGSTGIGSAGPTGNFANYDTAADWNGQDGNVTTVGTNGGPSAYQTFDMSGNVWEWNDMTGNVGSSRGIRGGNWSGSAFDLSASFLLYMDPVNGESGGSYGFRLAAAPVPEPSTCVMALAGLACGGWQMWRHRKRATEKERRRRPVGASR